MEKATLTCNGEGRINGHVGNQNLKVGTRHFE